MKRPLLSLGFLFLAMAALGCGKGAGNGGDDLPKPPDDKYRIAVVPKGLTHEHWKSVRRGAEQAARDLETKDMPIEIVWDGPKRESDNQVEVVDQLFQLGLHGLVLAPQHSKQLVRTVEKAERNGIAVIILDSDLDDRGLYLKYVATDNFQGGVLAAQHLLQRLDKKGVREPNLILFRYQPGSESTEQRERGFLAEVEKQKKAGKKITLLADTDYALATIDTAEKAAGPMLAREKGHGIDGIFAVNESATTGLLNALRGVPEVKERALIMGFDGSPALLKSLREDEVIGTVMQNPYRMGYLSVWLTIKHLEGYDINEGGEKKNLSTGEFVLINDRMEDDGKKYLFVDSDKARQLYDAASQPEQAKDLPDLRKR